MLTLPSDAVLKRLAWLDLSDVQHRFVTGGDTEAAAHANWGLCLEYRRFLLLRLAQHELDIPAPPLIDTYWRLHATDHPRFAEDCAALTRGADVSPEALAPPPQPSGQAAGPELRELYETTFPYGNADLWGWPKLEPGHRHSAPALGPVHIRLPSAIDEPTRTRLRDEAFDQRPHAVESHSASTGVNQRGHVYSGARMRHADRSPTLHDVHWKGAVPRLIAEQTGAIVSPDGCAYLYYRSGDYVGIHTDVYGNELALLTLLSGSVEPLHCHLHLGDTPLDEIRDLAEATNGLPEGGTPFDINAMPLLLSGQRGGAVRGDGRHAPRAGTAHAAIPRRGRVDAWRGGPQLRFRGAYAPKSKLGPQAIRSPVVSASVSASPGRSSRTPRSCCSTRPPQRWTRSTRRPSSRRWPRDGRQDAARGRAPSSAAPTTSWSPARVCTPTSAPNARKPPAGASNAEPHAVVRTCQTLARTLRSSRARPLAAPPPGTSTKDAGASLECCEPAVTGSERTPVTPLSDTVLRRLAWLDLSDAQQRFAASAGSAATTDAGDLDWLIQLWSLSVEYRRFLLLRLAYPGLDIPAPPLIERYWRLHAADPERFASDCALLTRGTDVSPDDLVPPPRPSEGTAGPQVRERYEAFFPHGHANLWGWPKPELEPGQRSSAPALGPVHSRMPSAIDEPTRTRLREEALALRRHHPDERPAGTRSGKPFIEWCADRSPVMHEVHWKGAVPQLIAEQTGAIVAPNSAGYIYYRSGDFVPIHTDSYGDDLVLLTLLSGGVEPLHCHLHLAEVPLDELEKLDDSNGLPEGGTPFDISAVPFLLSGQRIPHQRGPCERERETVVLAQFYGLLLPWSTQA